MNYILPEIHIKLGAERWSATDDLLREYVNENTDDAVHAIVALRVQRDGLLELLKSIINYPPVRFALAPRESLASLLAAAEEAIKNAEEVKP